MARDALVLGPSAALNRDPTATSGVNKSSQTVPQLCVSQQSTTSQPPCLLSRSGQLQEQGFSLPLRGHQQGPFTSQSGPYLRNGAVMVQRNFGGFLHSICEISLRLFNVPVPRSKQEPLDHRWLQDGHC